MCSKLIASSSLIQNYIIVRGFNLPLIISFIKLLSKVIFKFYYQIYDQLMFNFVVF